MMKSTPSPKDIERLSAYLDNQLNESQKIKIEKRLENEDALNIALETLRFTKNVLRSAAKVKIPRNFTLSPEMVAEPKRSWFNYSSMKFVSSIASILFVVVFLGDFINSNSLNFNLSSEKALTPAATSMEIANMEEGVLEMEDADSFATAPLAIEESSQSEEPTVFSAVELVPETSTNEMVIEDAAEGEIEVSEELFTDIVVLDIGNQTDDSLGDGARVGIDNAKYGDFSDNEQNQNTLENGVADRFSLNSIDFVILLKYFLASLALISWILSIVFDKK